MVRWNTGPSLQRPKLKRDGFKSTKPKTHQKKRRKSVDGNQKSLKLQPPSKN